jgi:NAD(P)-dependent dehydrogenase (short-subunit alcohol dehydrogenase family)
VLQAFAPKLDRGGQVRIGALSAQVGSIGDNALGGWYSYRMSKAALNMGIRCAAIELGRFRRGTVVAAIHPGTTRTPLTDGFLGNREVRGPDESARRIVELLDGLGPDDNGGFFHADGQPLPW